MDEYYPQNQTYLRRPVRSIPQEKEEVKYRIKTWMGAALIIVAFCVDLLELGITWAGVIAVGGVLSTLLSLVMGYVFWIWLMILGVSGFSNPKQFGTRVVTFLVEIIPAIDAIPVLSWLWTIGMIFIVVMARMEDRGENPSFLGAFGVILSHTGAGGMIIKKVLKESGKEKEIEDQYNRALERNNLRYPKSQDREGF